MEAAVSLPSGNHEARRTGIDPDRASQIVFFRPFVAAATLLALFVSTIPGPVAAARKPRLDPITDFMRVHGQPDSVEVIGKRNRAYHWRLTTNVGFSDDGVVIHEPFTCDVTALVSPSGRVLHVAARPGNPGAAAIASVGTFGPLCEKTFGLKPSHSRGR